MQYKITKGIITDAQKIHTLHEKYLHKNLSEEERIYGFIKVEYSLNDIKKIIEAKDIAICFCNELIIGYYLLGFVTKNEALSYQYKAIKKLSYNDELLSKLNVACGA